MKDCDHRDVTCINPYEFIRKYICNSCGEVMMCSCDENVGRRFFSHQLTKGTDPDTKKRIPVTIGFQQKICNTCRDIPEKAYPRGETYGKSSKIVRYYWREIYFETMIRFAKITKCTDDKVVSSMAKDKNLLKSIETEVIEEIKQQHEISPKYIISEESTKEILDKYNIEVINLEAKYLKHPNRKVSVTKNGKVYTIEELAEAYFIDEGFRVLFLESRPIHALFGVLTWILIQDPADPLSRISGFGDRFAYEKGIKGEIIWTCLPDDFGTSGYAIRRLKDINTHLADLPKNKEDLLWNFDYWIDCSSDFRQYLWAHKQRDVEIARQLISILPPEYIIRILKFLINDYWKRYLGWPDLLVYSKTEFFFVEVKSSKDKLSLDQKNWIKNNHDEINLPFKLLKIHRKR